MECNIGGIDRIIRAIVGLIIIGLGLEFHNWFGLIGIVLIATSVFGICVLYYPFKINTCKIKSK